MTRKYTKIAFRQMTKAARRAYWRSKQAESRKRRKQEKPT